MTLDLVIEAFTTRLLEQPDDILKHLHKGTSIPVLPEFHKYILRELEIYKAKAIVIEEKPKHDYFGKMSDPIVGIVVVYDDGSDTLFFGFCNVYDHNPEKIGMIVNALIEYAKEHGYAQVRGPINIPVYIYGWGFMAEGSNKNLFIGSPINPPVYQEIFLEKGFEVLFQEDRYEMAAMRMNPHTLPKLIGMGINTGNWQKDPFDTGDYPYEYINPGKEGMLKIIDEYAELFANYMPPSARITPKVEQNVESHINFIFEQGAEWMMWIVRYKPTGEIVACGYVIPNVFSKNKKKELDSLSFHAWVVHPEHRRSYLAMIMYGFTSLKAIDRKTPHYIRWGTWPVGADNEANGAAARKMGGKKDRSHLILQFEL